MTRAEDYREKAAAADEMAAQVFFSEVQEQFHQIADGWRALAAQADQLSGQVELEDRFIPQDAIFPR